MRQQLRLRVLVPVAVLGLLGAGFGAFAMGSPATPESIPVHQTSSGAADTGAVDTGAVDTAPAPTTTAPAPPTAGEVDAAEWSEQANALCAQLRNDVDALGEFESPKEATDWLAQAIEMVGAFETDFAALGWPAGEQAAVADLNASIAEEKQLLEQYAAALEANDADRLIELSQETPEQKAEARQTKAELRRLGADECAKSSPADWGPMRASAVLQWQLIKYPAVVVVFYAPGSPLDDGAVAEARAGAIATNAGFVAVDVTDEKQVAAIATGYEVLGSPTVLVIGRGPELRSHFDTFVDRETVAQAVLNARRG
jgi:hypothetical protein